MRKGVVTVAVWLLLLWVGTVGMVGVVEVVGTVGIVLRREKVERLGKVRGDEVVVPKESVERWGLVAGRNGELMGDKLKSSDGESTLSGKPNAGLSGELRG